MSCQQPPCIDTQVYSYYTLCIIRYYIQFFMSVKERQVTTIWFPQALAREAGRVAEKEGRTKSELIREAVRQYIWLSQWSRLRQIGTKRATDIGLRQQGIDSLIHEERGTRKKKTTHSH